MSARGELRFSPFRIGPGVSARRRYGDRAACTRCGHDIEWSGRPFGWTDRGAGRSCLPYIERGEIITPKAGTKHTIKEATQ